MPKPGGSLFRYLAALYIVIQLSSPILKIGYNTTLYTRVHYPLYLPPCKLKISGTAPILPEGLAELGIPVYENSVNFPLSNQTAQLLSSFQSKSSIIFLSPIREFSYFPLSYQRVQLLPLSNLRVPLLSSLQSKSYTTFLSPIREFNYFPLSNQREFRYFALSNQESLVSFLSPIKEFSWISSLQSESSVEFSLSNQKVQLNILSPIRVQLISSH